MVRDRIRALLIEGKTYSEIVAAVGCSKATINYHAKHLGLAKTLRQYDWAKVQAYHDAGNNRIACRRHFGFCADAWDKAVERGDLVSRDWRLPLDTLTAVGRQTQRSHLKERLLKAGLLQNACYECGLSEWRGRPLSLALHHVNGVGNDNRLENLQLLCPNCHSQTPNFAGRNKRALAAGE